MLTWGFAVRGTRDLADLGRCTLTVPLSKIGRPRHLPLSPAAVSVLQVQARQRMAGNPYVFPSRCIDGKPLESIRKPWERTKRASGLPADLRIHDLRHSLASALANADTPLYETGAVLGHRRLSTTTRYAHHSPQRMVETAATAARAWNLLPAPVASGDGQQR